MARVLFLFFMTLLVWGLALTGGSLSPSPNCFQSSRIASILIATESETEIEIPPCGFSVLHVSGGKPHPLVWPLVRRLTQLRELDFILPPSTTGPTHIRIQMKGNPDELWADTSYIMASSRRLEDGKDFEKAVVMSWLKGIEPNVARDHLRWEILSEALIKALVKNESPKPLSWLNGLMSFEEYCSSQSIANQHRVFCANGDLGEDAVLPTIWGFRDLLSSFVSDKVVEGHPRELRSRVSELIEVHSGSQISLPEDYSSLQSIEDWFLTEVSHLTGRRPERTAGPKKDLDILVSIDDELFEDHLEALSDPLLKSAGVSLGFISEGQLLSLPSLKRTGFWADGVRSQLRVHLGCGFPSVSQVSGELSDRYIAFDLCRGGGGEQFDLRALLQDGELPFVKAWNQLPHAYIHVPSLHRLLQTHPSRNLEDLAVFTNIEWNPETRSYRSRWTWPVLLSLRGIR